MGNILKLLGFFNNKKQIFLFCFVILLACIIRLANFPSLPSGLNRDEVNSGYEAYALLTHGTDKWGLHLPVYFVSWGSGENVLESYLDIPLIKVFGLNPFSIRILPFLISILTLVVLYFLIKELYTYKVALLATFLLAISPWHIMLSRWGLESNLLPFFVVLGIFTFIKSINNPTNIFWGVICFIPFAFCLYAYGIVFYILPLFLLALIYYKWKKSEKIETSSFFSLIILLILSLPFLFFVLQTYFFRHSINLSLPISIPFLQESRVSQVNTTFLLRILQNAKFVLVGFNDSLPKNIDINVLPANIVPGFMPLFFLSFPLAIYGTYVSVKKYKLSYQNIFLWYLICCIPLFFLVNLNINRFNTGYIPIIVFNAVGVIELFKTIKNAKYKNIVVGSILILFTLYSLLFLFNYFVNYPKEIARSFNAGLSDAIRESQRLKSNNDKVYITDSIVLNYAYFLFYDRIDSENFSKNVIFKVENGEYKVNSYKAYYFSKPTLATIRDKSYIYVIKDGDMLQCSKNYPLYKYGFWIVGRCYT